MRRSRARQELPERIEDPAAVALLAAILRDTRAPPPSESTDRERNSQHEPASGGGDRRARRTVTPWAVDGRVIATAIPLIGCGPGGQGRRHTHPPQARPEPICSSGRRASLAAEGQ